MPDGEYIDEGAGGLHKAAASIALIVILGVTLSPSGYQSGKVILAVLFCWSFIYFSEAYATQFEAYLPRSITGYTVSKCLGWTGLVALLLIQLFF
jgi:hypothetical protein